MKRDWLQYICDPLDGSALTFAAVTEQQGEHVIAGQLKSASGRTYDISQGIPVLLTKQMQSKESVQSFAFEWDEFGFLYAKEGWIRDIVGPLVGGTEFFKDKIVADAGAGSGAQSRWMAEAGAKLVLSLELSECIFTRHHETIAGYEDVVFPIQCDIAHPPLRLSPEVLYCINVLQHTANPRETFLRLAGSVGERTVFLFNIYTKRSELKFRTVRLVRRLIRGLPFRVWKSIAFLITCIAYPLAQVAFLRKFIRVICPISHSFRETWLDVYDAFGGHYYQENMTRADQMRMVQDAGLVLVREATFGYVVLHPSNVGIDASESKEHVY